MENLLKCNILPWKNIYDVARITSRDTMSRMFQFKIFHNILYLNNALFKCNLSDSPLCSYCEQEPETVQHLFYKCQLSKKLWHEIQNFFISKLSLPSLDLQSALFGFFDNPTNNYIPNNVLLIFKLTLYKHRKKSTPTLTKILKNLKDREFLERKCAVSENRISNHNDKWAPIALLL